jgi:hypothetical protein
LNFSELGEAKIITNNFSAEYGRNSSSQVIYTTKGGSNDLHGELYEYLQNDKLNARPFFDRSGKTNIVRQNTFGFSVGGPVYIPKLADLRNKLFWRVSYEGFKQRGAGAARIAQVPNASMLAQVTDRRPRPCSTSTNCPPPRPTAATSAPFSRTRRTRRIPINSASGPTLT